MRMIPLVPLPVRTVLAASVLIAPTAGFTANWTSIVWLALTGVNVYGDVSATAPPSTVTLATW